MWSECVRSEHWTHVMSQKDSRLVITSFGGDTGESKKSWENLRSKSKREARMYPKGVIQ
jgi:hypothetical protein